MQFVDDRRLPPAFRFFHRHRVVDEKGKVLGYKNLDLLRERLRGILLRRTRDSVLQQLPPRTTELVRIPPTEEQAELHSTHMRIVSMITRKPYISEMDLLRLQKALLMCRMTANSTVLVDKQKPGYSSKLAYLEELLDGLFQEADRKVLLFSEWTKMLDLIEPLLKARKLDYVRLDGQVPQKDRQALVNRFREDPNCRLFITTNAGSTGLNLQAANTVINVDLPWNPADAGAADRPRAPHGPAAAGAGLRAGDGGDDRGRSAEHAFREARPGVGRARSRVGRDAGRSGERHGRIAEPAGGAFRREAGSAGGRQPEARGGGGNGRVRTCRGNRRNRRDRRRWQSRCRVAPSAASAWPPPAASCWAPSSISSASWWRKRPRHRPPRA